MTNNIYKFYPKEKASITESSPRKTTTTNTHTEKKPDIYKSVYASAYVLSKHVQEVMKRQSMR